MSINCEPYSAVCLSKRGYHTVPQHPEPAENRKTSRTREEGQGQAVSDWTPHLCQNATASCHKWNILQRGSRTITSDYMSADRISINIEREKIAISRNLHLSLGLQYSQILQNIALSDAGQWRRRISLARYRTFEP
jgi:hypothetical protein